MYTLFSKVDFSEIIGTKTAEVKKTVVILNLNKLSAYSNQQLKHLAVNLFASIR